MTILDRLNQSDDFIFFDGAMGTMIQKRGIELGEHPEELNFTHAEIITQIHQAYVNTGSQIIITNTFGANSLKLANSQYSVTQVIGKAVELAQTVKGNPYIALDLGPLGELLEPVGNLPFEKAYQLYKEQVIAGTEAGADLILIETITDLYEARAAILAAKEHSTLPIFCTMTFQENGRTLTGTDPITLVHVLEGLGVDALGVNCSLGPQELIPIIENIVQHASIPIIVSPNAGLPIYQEGKTHFPLDPSVFADTMKKIGNMGVRILGGCCGTTPEYIELMISRLKGIKPPKLNNPCRTMACSPSHCVEIGSQFTIIGEKINPTGNKTIKEALRTQNYEKLLQEAIRQKDAGANILDVNVGIPEINEPEVMQYLVKELQGVVDLPLQIDSSNMAAIEKSVRIYNGKPIINSVTGKEKHMAQIFPIVKKYGACVIGLTMDEEGLPKTVEQRVKIAEKIITTANKYRIPKKDIIIDCLVLTASAQQDQCWKSLQAIKCIKEQFGVHTILGISNVSYGLPNRSLINQSYLLMALAHGLDAGIINPNDRMMTDAIRAFNVLRNIDQNARKFIDHFKRNPPHFKHQPKSSQITTSSDDNVISEESLESIIIKGLKDKAADKAEELLLKMQPLQIVNRMIVPSLDKVGALYEQNEIFLPQLLRSADTVKAAFNIIKKKMQTDSLEGEKKKNTVLLATVRGDVHDIGKNIVKILLENYGFTVIDLGKDVDDQNILSAIDEYDAQLVGLSALMTTTVENMREIIEKIHQHHPSLKIMVGGAVLNPQYAAMIQADFYGKDAQEAVKIAKKVFQTEPLKDD